MRLERTCFYCAACHEAICEGDTYVELNGFEFCEQCIDAMSKLELVDAAGGEVKEANEIDCVRFEEEWEGALGAGLSRAPIR